MSASHAAPISTIAHDDALTESHGFMVGHREEAQRTLDRELKAGLPPRVALAKAGRAILAARRAQIMHLAELPHLAA
jgi:ribosomal protein L34